MGDVMKLSSAALRALKALGFHGPIPREEFDGRCLRGLFRWELVEEKIQKSGTFVKLTNAGRKLLKKGA
jgi:hypothetical protein